MPPENLPTPTKSKSNHLTANDMDAPLTRGFLYQDNGYFSHDAAMIAANKDRKAYNLPQDIDSKTANNSLPPLDFPDFAPIISTRN